jgi:hypothetical protein
MKKFLIVSMVAVAGLSVAACGGTKPAEEAAANVTEMNVGEAMNGTTTDTMTNADAATGESANMTADANATAPDANAMAPAADNAAK